MLKICLSLATSCPNFVYLHQESKDNATLQCKKAPPPTSSHHPSLLTYSIVKTTKLLKQTKPHDENKDYNECFSTTEGKTKTTTDGTDKTDLASHYTAIARITKGFHGFLIRMAIFNSKNLFSLFSFLFFSVLMQNKNDLPSEYNSFQKK